MCCTRGKSIPGISQSVRVRCGSEKSQSFGLCQVDMYALVSLGCNHHLFRRRVGIHIHISHPSHHVQPRFPLSDTCKEPVCPRVELLLKIIIILLIIFLGFIKSKPC